VKPLTLKFNTKSGLSRDVLISSLTLVRELGRTHTLVLEVTMKDDKTMFDATVTDAFSIGMLCCKHVTPPFKNELDAFDAVMSKTKINKTLFTIDEFELVSRLQAVILMIDDEK